MAWLQRIADAIPYRDRLRGENTLMERQELWCHDCDRYVQFDVDLSLNGNHVLDCPNCGHEHCRVVENGKITDIRWAQRNGPTLWINGTVGGGGGGITSTTASTYDTSTSGNSFLYSSWMNSTGAAS